MQLDVKYSSNQLKDTFGLKKTISLKNDIDIVGSPEGTPLEESQLLRKMYFAYILKSLKDNKYYYGSTGNIESRLKQHNYGKVKSTKNRLPLILHYSEKFTNNILPHHNYFSTDDLTL